MGKIALISPYLSADSSELGLIDSLGFNVKYIAYEKGISGGKKCGPMGVKLYSLKEFASKENYYLVKDVDSVISICPKSALLFLLYAQVRNDTLKPIKEYIRKLIILPFFDYVEDDWEAIVKAISAVSRDVKWVIPIWYDILRYMLDWYGVNYKLYFPKRWKGALEETNYDNNSINREGVVWYGRNTYYKRYDVLNEVAILTKRSITFDAIYLEFMSRHRKLEKSIKKHGKLSYKDWLELLKKRLVYLHTGIRETYAFSISDAIKCGCVPVILFSNWNSGLVDRYKYKFSKTEQAAAYIEEIHNNKEQAYRSVKSWVEYIIDKFSKVEHVSEASEIIGD